MRTIVCYLGQHFLLLVTHLKRNKAASSSAGEREKKRNLDPLNSAVNIISESKFEPLPCYIDIQWDTPSERTRNEYTEKAEDVVTLILATIAPYQEEPL